MRTPIGCHDIHSKRDFFHALSSLITANLDVRRWVLKLDKDGDDNRSRTAYLDVDK